MVRKVSSLLAVIAILFTVFVAGGCNKKEEASDSGTPKPVSFWYMWTGTDAQVIENLIKQFNESQSKYVVTGLSVADETKIIAAITSGEGPDITDSFSSNVASYASKGILEPLDTYISKDNFTKNMVQSSLSSCVYKKVTYALPINAGEGLMMYYNKKLLKDAGYDKPPETLSQFIEVANKTTQVDKSGAITVEGFPNFPFVYYTNSMTYALGGSLANDDSTELTPDNAATIKALQINADWRKKFGEDKVEKFESASGGYVTAQDCFITGHQALRFDGTWLVNFIDQFNKDLDYGIAMLPYPDGKPELQGGDLSSPGILYITSNAKEKTGAWEFMKYCLGPVGNLYWQRETKGIPVDMTTWTDSSISSSKSFVAFTEKVKKNNMKFFPLFPSQSEYSTALANYYEKAVKGDMTPEAAMKECKDTTKNLLN